MVTSEQIHACLAVQFQHESAGETPPPLGRVLVEQGMMTVAQVEEILRLQQARARAGAAAGDGAVGEVAFGDGDVLLRRGDSDDRDLLILLDGRVEARRDGRVVETFTEKGAFLGAISALLGTAHPTDVIAVGPVRVLRIPAESVIDVLRERPAMALRLLESLAGRLARTMADASTPVPAPDDDEGAAGVLELNYLAGLRVGENGALTLDGIRDPERTFVNGEPVAEPRAVADEDFIQVGRYMVQVFLDHPHCIDVDRPGGAEDDTGDDATSEAAAAPPPPAPTSETLSDAIGDGAPDADALAAIVDALVVPPLSDEAREAIEARLALQADLNRLDAERNDLGRGDDLADDVARELSRQRRELRKIPPVESLRKSMGKLEKKLDRADDEDDEEAPALPETLRRACELGLEQKRLLLARAESTAGTLRACAAAVTDEPLYGILAKHAIPGDQLFGWAVYALALAEQFDEAEAQREALRDDGDDGAEPSEDAPAEQQAVEAGIEAIRRERKLIEREMVQAFWSVYEGAAVALTAGVDEVDEPFVRAFLRRGLLGCSSRFVPPEIAKAILAQCAEPLREFDDGPAAVHVLYADESIDLATAGAIPNAHDEALELREANSPRWKADRGWRRKTNYRIQERILTDAMHGLEAAAEKLRHEQDTLAKQMALVKPAEKGSRNKREALRTQAHELKVEAVRKDRLVEVIGNTYLPRLREKLQASIKMEESAGHTITPADRARGEVAFIRQQCRLVAQLSEPFLPFGLENAYRSGGEGVNERDTVIAEFADAEQRDPLLFRDSLVPGAKKAHRVLLRTAPIVVLLPAGGTMAIATTPRCDGDNGSFALPGRFTRPGLLRASLWNALADYRYDTSKAASGVDAMNSDTLVAAYAEFRWSVRKKNRDARQKLGVYNEENDRANWRRHYDMYMNSADDNGKQLFFKSADLYQRIIGKFIELPEGGEILKRA
ncbi:MAG: cyclic nucleotide-binding domain-containing protein [Planctomycetota bacterium]